MIAVLVGERVATTTPMVTRTAADSRQTSPAYGLRVVLPAHHRQIEYACVGLMAAAMLNDRRVIGQAFRELEYELLEHLTAEEELMFPAYELSEPAEAHQLRADHARLRELLASVAVAIELQAIHLDDLQALVDLLRSHAQREDASMYRWAQHHLSVLERKEVFGRIRHWRR